jgi:membrane protein DedA with SNARE-associated domain
MENITSFLLSYVLLYKYLAIFIITYLGALAFPLPSGTVVMASAVFSTQGYLSFPLVVVTAILGNVAGDNTGYWITRRYGVRALHLLGMRKVVGSEKYQKVHESVNNHPILIIYFSRFMTGIAPTVNVISGTTRLAYKKYLTFEFLGECTEVLFFATTGYFFGANWEYLNEFSWEFWAILFSGIIFTYLFGRFVFKKRRNQK